MAYWFHRNPLKATASTNFDLKMVVIESEAVKMRDELRVGRAALLDVISNPSNSVEELESKSNHYLALLQGLILPMEEAESKMRFTLRFRWTNTMLGRVPSARQDTLFELASILQNLALWYMKHAAMLAGKDDISMDQAKEIHRLLRKAAGIFAFVQEKQASVLSAPERSEPGSDLDPQVMSAYITQCSAEAQEVAIARAVEMKHSSSLVSSLAAETSKMFSSAETSLARLDPTKFGKWQLYLRLKSVFYLSLAYCHCGESLLALENCGDAVRALRESQTLYQEAGKLCADYVKSKGPGTSARPQEHPFFRKLGPVVARTLEKCVRENGFIYHQKVADKPPQLETKASYGIATPEPYQLPDLSPKWTPICYAAFVGARVQPVESKAAVAAEGELPPVTETDVQHSGKEPKNTSGCVLQ